jgi:diguanylate cyclase (GGDEF)-like protein
MHRENRNRRAAFNVILLSASYGAAVLLAGAVAFGLAADGHVGATKIVAALTAVSLVAGLTAFALSMRWFVCASPAADAGAHTKLPDKANFMAELKRRLKLSEGSDVYVILADLDGFRSINEAYGREFGDWVLETAARRISVCVRQTDAVARFDGDGFAITLFCENSDLVYALMERVRKSIERMDLFHEGQNITAPITISLGGTKAPSGAGADAAVGLADKALLMAKKKQNMSVLLLKL